MVVLMVTGEAEEAAASVAEEGREDTKPSNYHLYLLCQAYPQQ
jgi:hypothetical protein